MNNVYSKNSDDFLSTWNENIQKQLKNFNFDAFTLNFISKIIKSFNKDFNILENDLKGVDLQNQFLKIKDDNPELSEYKDLKDALKFLFIRINMYESRKAYTKYTGDIDEDINSLKKLYFYSQSLLEIIQYTGNSISFKNTFKEDLISKFIENFKIPSDITLYRLTNILDFKKLFKIDSVEKIIGENLISKNVISTSIKPFKIEETNFETGDFNVFLKIFAPKDVSAFPTDICSAIKGENEILLPIGTEFKVKNFDKNYKYIDGNIIEYYFELYIENI